MRSFRQFGRLRLGKGVLAVCAATLLAIPAGSAIASHHRHASADTFKAHLYASGACTGRNCPKPGSGWASSVTSGPEKGAAQLTSWQNGFGGMRFAASKRLTFNGLKQLQTDYALTWGTCKAGSPRWQINVLPPNVKVNAKTIKTAKNIFVYFGAVPTSGNNACPEADGSEVNTGNYIGTAGPGDTPGRYDTSQLAAGTQVSTYTATETAFGAYQVVGIQLVVDSGWSQAQSDHEQQAVLDTVKVNGVTSFADRSKNAEDTI